MTLLEGLNEAAAFCRNMGQNGLAACVRQAIELIELVGEPQPLGLTAPPHIVRELTMAYEALRQCREEGIRVGHRGTIATAEGALDGTFEGEEKAWRGAFDALTIIAAFKEAPAATKIAAEALEKMPKASLRFGV